MQDGLKHAVGQFQIEGEMVEAQLFGSGHINVSFVVTYEHEGQRSRYMLQRINHQVFKKPEQVMDNILRVTRHLRKHLIRHYKSNVSRKALTVIPTRDGEAYCQDEHGAYWRSYIFIENTRTFDAAETPEQAFEAAHAFGSFQRLMVDLPGPRLHETIPDFHNTPLRLQTLQKAVVADVAGRVETAKADIEFAMDHQELASLLADLHQAGGLPERVIHNDTKFNNVLFDEVADQAICIIDLDTVMPGLIHYDFGDMVRTATSPAEEDEKDLDKVTMQLPMFRALVRGYLSAANHFLTATEKAHLVNAGKVIIYEQGLRFLADYLVGDFYYPAAYEGHNLIRGRAQFKLLQSLIEQEDAINKFMERILNP